MGESSPVTAKGDVLSTVRSKRVDSATLRPKKSRGGIVVEFKDQLREPPDLLARTLSSAIC